jgi:hypothetical protein
MLASRRGLLIIRTEGAMTRMTRDGVRTARLTRRSKEDWKCSSNRTR